MLRWARTNMTMGPDTLTMAGDYMRRTLMTKPIEVDPESEQGRYNKMINDLGREMPKEFFSW